MQNCYNMKPIVLVIVLISYLVPVTAQDNPLRDSLKTALEKLSYHPDSVDLLLKKAAWNIELEQWQFAKESYDVVLAKEPMNVAALYFRAYVNEKLNRLNFARLDYENLLAIVPGNFEAQLGLALLNHKDKHYTKAMDMVNHLVSQYPDSAVVYAARAGMEKDRGMLELAEYDYSEAVRRDPNNADYLLNHADMLIELKRWSEAKSVLGRLVASGVPEASLSGLYRRIRKRR